MNGAQPRRQRGVTLVIGLVMLVLLLLMAVSAFVVSRTNTAITGNMQHKAEATNAAVMAVEQTISSSQFTDTPANAIPASSSPCGTNQACFDVNSDGNNDITVTLDPPPCIKKIQVIKNTALDITDPNDMGCALGVSQNLGVSGAASGNSLCADSVWEINATASDGVTQAESTVTTGVSVRVPADHALDASKACS